MKPALALPLLLSGAACAGSGALSRAGEAFRRGDFRTASIEYGEALRRRPGDAKIARAAREAQRGAALAQAREAFFEGYFDDALAILDPLAEADPQDGMAAAWRAKVRKFVADTLVRRGREAMSGEDFAGARVAFERALEFFPGHPEAAKGATDLALEVARRTGRADEYYLAGMQAYGESRLDESRAGFRNSLKYNPAHRRAGLRNREVARQMALARVEAAEEYAKERRYGAAYREAALAGALDPTLEGAGLLRSSMKSELEVQDSVRKAAFEGDRGNFAAARDLLEKALARTAREAEREEIRGMLRDLAEGELERLYLSAVRLESDRRIEPALAKYRELLSRSSHYRDATGRAEGLESLMRHVEELYAEAETAESAGDLATARKRIEEISAIYPEYRDAAERRARLEAGASGPAATSPAAPPEGPR